MNLIKICYRNEANGIVHNEFENVIANLTTVEANTFENRIMQILKDANDVEIKNGEMGQGPCGDHLITIYVKNTECNQVDIVGNPVNGKFSNSGEVKIGRLTYQEANSFENTLISFLQDQNSDEIANLSINKASPPMCGTHKLR